MGGVGGGRIGRLWWGGMLGGGRGEDWAAVVGGHAGTSVLSLSKTF